CARRGTLYGSSGEGFDYW
nr:immunoglobulin heavy chain junction region [Mus musculus]MBK4184921.1 immunoglobulin heavy chain junction region [Mus musculus]MBK4184922.1 immunoglobulin heavy chain junction region [Mus musculus]MBK4184923.1 immunoglobulin heavy chain junction region [Mus musculus]